MNEKAIYHVMKIMEEKLEQLMDPKEYQDFMLHCGREGFLYEVRDLPEDNDFRQFVESNMDMIDAGVKEMS